MPAKFLYSVFFIFLAIIVVMDWWQYPAVMISAIVLLAIAKHAVMPIAREFLWFCISGIMGASTESIMMFAGPWSYAQRGIVNIPLWLPFLWGLAGTIAISLYESLTEPGRQQNLTKQRNGR